MGNPVQPEHLKGTQKQSMPYVGPAKVGQKPKGLDLSEYVMDEKEYFGFEESMIEKSSPVHKMQDENESINLSEYLDKAYDRFDPNYKIRFEDDDA
jgi:hypothetical protein